MSEVYFSCNIIIFDTYQLSSEANNQIPDSSKLSINNNNNVQSKQMQNLNLKETTTNIPSNEIDFFSENNINKYNILMRRNISFFPIIRIFGTTKLGQKCCVNIHNYLPYFYIGLTNENYFNYNNTDTLFTFATILEETFLEYRKESKKTSIYKNNNKNNNNQEEEQPQIIHNIIPVIKTNIYGYFNKPSTFLKIECYNPKDIPDLMYVLNQGAVNGTFFQCYDAHISHSTNFFRDFNLFGMGDIKIKNFSFRKGLILKNTDIDFNKNFTVFQNNIKWNSDNNTDNNTYSNEDIKNFIKQNNEFMIWDKKYIELMNLTIKYNKFNKSSSSNIEIDCTINDIIMEDDMSNINDIDLNNSNKNLNEEVNETNIKMHITHCSSLIDLWKDEIKRRKNENKPPLKFTKISDQGVFTLTEDYFLKHKKESEYLLKLNYKIIDINNKNELFNSISENKKIETNTDFNEIQRIINKKYNYRKMYMEKFCGRSYEWYKDHYNKTFFENILDVITQIETDDQKMEQEVENFDEFYKIKEDYDFDLSCFCPNRTLDEQSIPIDKRKIAKDLITNKTFEDFNLTPNNKNINFNSTIVEESHSNSYSNNKKSDEKYNKNLLDSWQKLFSGEKEDLSKISNGKYLLLGSTKLKKIIKNRSSQKISQSSNSCNKDKKNETNNKKEKSENEIINEIYYSNPIDYKNYYKPPIIYNKIFKNYKGNSLEYMILNYNKIVYKPKKLEKIATELLLDENSDIDSSINKSDNYKLNQNNIKNNEYYDNQYFYKLNDSEEFKFDNIEEINYNDNLSYKKLINEISPITEKKQKNNPIDNMITPPPKSTKPPINPTPLPDFMVTPIPQNKESDNKNNNNLIINNSNNSSSVSVEFRELFGSEISNSVNNTIKLTNKNNSNVKLFNLFDKNYESNNNMIIMSIELFPDSQSNIACNYFTDPIFNIFISIYDDNYINNKNLSSQEISKNKNQSQYFYNLIITCLKEDINCFTTRHNYAEHILKQELYTSKKNENENIEIIFTKDEIELFRKFIDIIQLYDPDIICGYEPEMLSIGYIIKRGESLGIPILKLVNRLNNSKTNNLFTEEYIRKIINNNNINNDNKKEDDVRNYDDYKKISKFQMKFNNIVKIKGRIILDVWRLMSEEIKTNDYSIENVLYNSLNIKESHLEYFELKNMFLSKDPKKIICVLLYYMKRAKYNLELLNKYDIINRTCQFVRIYGIDFESNLVRGTQYKVEGVLSRLAKSKNVVLLSANRDQLINQTPPKFTPIVFEPPKNIFYNPVIVLDFQSLYPSIMIAYNLCYSTCLGRLLKEENNDIENNNNLKSMGVSVYNKNLYEAVFLDFQKSKFYHKEKYINNNSEIENDFENFIKNSCFLSPCGVLFVKKHIKEGLIPIILKELLLTRIMIKNSMKLYDKNSETYKFLHNRQLGIKSLANVIYGYTSAGYSGRMPNIEISDSILSIGRKMLGTAIKHIEKNKNCKVIYGDTDSLFISVFNKNKEEAIIIGKKLADEITKMNPEPIKLQFEKVYCPLIFAAKKHYAGYKYEDLSQINKTEKKISDIIKLDTKGLENVRRDSCALISKIVEKTIKILFDEKDLSKLKQYLFNCFDKINGGRVILKDFIFSKEVKFGRYRGKLLPPSAQVANDLHNKDPNFFALYKQRVPYLVYNNINGQKTLKDCVIYPYEFISHQKYTIKSDFYINMIKQVMKRFIGELGVDIDLWYKDYKRPFTIQYNIFYYKNINLNNYSNIDDKKNEINNSKPFLESKYTLRVNTKKPDIKNFLNRNSVNSKNDIDLLDNVMSQSDKKELDEIKIDVKVYEADSKNNIIEIDNEEAMNEILKEISDKQREKQRLFLEKNKKLKLYEKRKMKIKEICGECSGFKNCGITDIEDIPCINIQCDIFYEKLAIKNEIEEIKNEIKKFSEDKYIKNNMNF